MADSSVRLIYNPNLATDYDAASDVHTLSTTPSAPANVDSFIRWDFAFGARLATDLVSGIHTLKVKAV
jgi:hypothetical protein